MENLTVISSFITSIAPVISGFVPFLLSLAVLAGFVAICIIGWRK
ncbi:Uncharacterised protein [Klebsiella pneumoniae]|jgi:hypothetical protein|nr:hypothetical protein [Klebsiella pneumoniae]SCA39323.1 Uncharacterised protein [Klebsiella quasipneumoniae]SCA40032.1 Uncharacterised protein [Klebsiella quasipneumoniae]SSF84362.1 Uncharacterised protein [Klebsiella pneumoniae]SSH34608.1 Uncharacterised protein [Klebsiella pneumoniae]SSJ53065.1 Uncharacterised protein [Klebsiella pneumoniae]